jgi:hypothetical protein
MRHTGGLLRRDSVWWSVGGNSLEARLSGLTRPNGIPPHKGV